MKKDEKSESAFLFFLRCLSNLVSNSSIVFFYRFMSSSRMNRVQNSEGCSCNVIHNIDSLTCVVATILSSHLFIITIFKVVLDHTIVFFHQLGLTFQTLLDLLNIRGSRSLRSPPTINNVVEPTLMVWFGVKKFTQPQNNQHESEWTYKNYVSPSLQICHAQIESENSSLGRPGSVSN